MNGPSFFAFVRKYGRHKPKGGSYREWDAQLLELVIKDVNKYWGSFERKLADCTDAYLARIVKLLDNIRNDLSGEDGHHQWSYRRTKVLTLRQRLRESPCCQCFHSWSHCHQRRSTCIGVWWCSLQMS